MTECTLQDLVSLCYAMLEYKKMERTFNKDTHFLDSKYYKTLAYLYIR